MNKNILYICGSRNQTIMLHRISQNIPGYNHYFTPYYADGIERVAARLGLLDFSVLGGEFYRQSTEYFAANNLQLDFRGEAREYELVIICSDLIIPKNIKGKRIVLVQEGMTDPENLPYKMVKKLGIPYYFGGTAATGLSDMYEIFCVASEGYRELFEMKGVKPEKIRVTGIPNFDNCAENLDNDFPHKGYALVCTSDARETYKTENRKKFILKAKGLSEGKQMIFKLHPNENVPRATREINKYAPGSIVYHKGKTDEMVANCDILITHYSSVVYVGIALGKKVHSSFDINELHRLSPIQNKGASASIIAGECLKLLEVTVSKSVENNLDNVRIAGMTA
ncbi:MAG: hypothetical protein IPG02_08835 [Ignavibacteria bacterium]|nr:hypothetical protein [Ignavibacteria bacterium]